MAKTPKFKNVRFFKIKIIPIFIFPALFITAFQPLFYRVRCIVVFAVLAFQTSSNRITLIALIVVGILPHPIKEVFIIFKVFFPRVDIQSGPDHFNIFHHWYFYQNRVAQTFRRYFFRYLNCGSVFITFFYLKQLVETIYRCGTSFVRHHQKWLNIPIWEGLLCYPGLESNII